MNQKTVISIALAFAMATFSLTTAQAAAQASDERVVVTTEGEGDIASVTVEFTTGRNPLMVVEDTVYKDGHRIRKEYRPHDGTLKSEEEFVKHQLVGGRINWRLTRRFVYAQDGQTVVEKLYFDLDGNPISTPSTR